MSKLSIKELQRYPYPNLMAEIMESGYSICTIGEHMGLGKYREDDDPEVCGRLTGRKEILYSEAIGLVRLFGVDYAYLFSHDLAVASEKPIAYWRWIEDNRKKERELRKYRMQQKVIEVILEIDNEEYLELIQRFAEKLLEGGAE